MVMMICRIQSFQILTIIKKTQANSSAIICSFKSVHGETLKRENKVLYLLLTLTIFDLVGVFFLI